MSSFKIQVMIADDHPALLIGLKHELTASPIINLVGAVPDSTQLICLLDEHSCDVLVTDYAMPGGRFGDGTPLLTFIKRRYPSLKIVVYTMFDNPAFVRDLVRHDIRCILSKSDSVQHITYAIRAAYADKSYFSPTVKQIVQRLEVNPDEMGNLRALSKRETEVIRLYVAGYTINEIAAQLHRSKQTISSQKQRAMQKLGVEREPDLFRYALEAGLM